MKTYLIIVAVLHVVFMITELFPWELPVLLGRLTKKLPDGEPLKTAQRELVSTIVHNAGIYNGIVAGGLLWAAYAGPSAIDLARAMLIGAAAAGIFGTATLKSLATALQGVLGIIGLFVIQGWQ